MWCSTAWPKTMSKLASSKGRVSASVALALTFRSSFLALSFSAFSIPGEMSVAVALKTAPAFSRLSVK